jgi:signal transduction histidine kinase
MAATSEMLRRFKIFEAFTDEELTEIAWLCRQESYPDGFSLFGEDAPAEKLYLILEGKISLEKKVQLGRSGSSRQATVSIRGPGLIVGWSSVVPPHAYAFSGICLEPCKLLALEGQNLRDFIVRNPESGLKFMIAIATIVRGRMKASISTMTYFLSITSHELKAPLAAVENYLEVMLGGFAGELTDKQQKMLERSALRIKDLRHLINDILDMARMQPEHVQADFEHISPAEIIMQSMEDVRLIARQKEIQIYLEVPPEIDEIVAAPRRLRQVLTNLLSNAIKFSPEKGRVWLHAVEEPDSLRVEVTDEGAGIPADEQPYVFEDFFQARNVKDEGGTGLGLSIAKKIVEAHRGQIWFESPYAAGKPGVKFTVVIPRNLATPAMKLEEWASAEVKRKT